MLTWSRNEGTALASCFADNPTGQEQLLLAELEGVRGCPARSGYIELRFKTPEGSWNWCFPRPSRRRKRPGSPVALTVGPYGAQARLVREDGPGPALPGSSALSMILAGVDVYVARRLVAATS
jgi:hypothetical protein